MKSISKSENSDLDKNVWNNFGEIVCSSRANPIFLIPFILAPTCCGIISFLAFQANLVYRPFIEVPWVLPAFFGAPLCCQDSRALILLLVNMTVSAFIWLPFLKAYEKKLSESRKTNDEK